MLLLLPAEYFALATAVLVALSNILAEPISKKINPLEFNRIRLNAALLFLIAIALIFGKWTAMPGFYAVAMLAISGVIGITAGDSFIYACISKIGAHKASMLYIMNVPITIVMGIILLNDVPTTLALTGSMLILVGIYIVIFHRSETENSLKNTLNETKQSSVNWLGTLYGLAGASCQSVGILVARPIMAEGTDPFTASIIRILFGIVLLVLILKFFISSKSEELNSKLKSSEINTVRICGVLGMGLGMTALLHSLKNGQAGLMASLASLTPVFILILLFLWKGMKINLHSLIGTVCSCVGVALVFNFS